MKKTIILSLLVLFPTTSMIHAGPYEGLPILIGSTTTGVGLYGLYKLSQGLHSTKKSVRVASKAISTLVCAASALAAAGIASEFAYHASYGGPIGLNSNRNCAIGFGIASALSVLGSCLFAESAIQEISR